MNDKKPEKPKVFVIMPFGRASDEEERFRKIYDRIADVARDGGFIVSRADDLSTSQSIMQNIVSSIEDANIVIADLTGLNSNVLYELGIAHTLDKPTITISQDDPASAPFDISPYRIIRYGIFLTEFDGALNILKDIFISYLDRESIFGNPVSTSRGRSIPLYGQVINISETVEESQVTSELVESSAGDGTEEVQEHSAESNGQSDSLDAGILDHVVVVEEATDSMTEILEVLSDDQQKVSAEFQRSTTQLQRTQSARDRIVIARRVATVVNNSAQVLKTKGNAYSVQVDRLESSLQFTVRNVSLESEAARAEAEGFIDVLGKFESQTRPAIESIAEYRAVLRDFPRVERNLSRAMYNQLGSLAFIGKVFERQRVAIVSVIGSARLRLSGSE